MRGTDLDEADRIMRLAFGTFLGLPDPMKFMGDADYVRTRYKADPSAALVSEVEGKLVGSNFALNWGSVGIFGPLTVHPDFWDKGVARQLLDETMRIFQKWDTRHTGLFTFAQSSKHVHLYQKFGFWPRFLTSVMSKQIDLVDHSNRDIFQRYSKTTPHERRKVIEECHRLTDAIYPGLDLRKEIASVDMQGLGDTILVRDPNDKEMIGLAICHTGPGTEAGTGNCYIKFGAVKPTTASAQSFDILLDVCESYAASHNASRLVGGVNTGRHRAYKRLIERGFRTDLQGIAMHRPNESGYNLPDVFLIDDWR
jgi:Acetyltransferases